MIFTSGTFAQDKQAKKDAKKAMMRDTLDGKFDFSRVLIDFKGFIPVPFIITEPALGSFGLAVAPLFIQRKNIPGFKGHLPPDITAGFGMFTVNGSWGIGGLRIGSFPKAGLKYRVGTGYFGINLSYYRTLPQVGEKEFSFNIKALPLLLSLSKKVSQKSEIYLGMQYQFAKAQLTPKFKDTLPSFITKESLDQSTAALGGFVDWDIRDNIFTPDKGGRINVLYAVNDQWTGSDFEYQMLNGSINWFSRIKPNWIAGFRTDVKHAFGDPPFYVLPSIEMRGIPLFRYQGYTTALLETEQRFDLKLRWSVVAFGGIGKAIEKNQSFSDAKNVYSVGTGFRYLIARAFKIRTGIDIAKGPDSFGWYIVFGHNWNR